MLFVPILLKNEFELLRTIFLHALIRAPLIPMTQQQIHACYANKCDSFHSQRHGIAHNISRLITSRVDLRRSNTRNVGDGNQQRYPNRPHMLVLQVIRHPSQDESVVWVNTLTTSVKCSCMVWVTWLTCGDKEHGKQASRMIVRSNHDRISRQDGYRRHHSHKRPLSEFVRQPGREAENHTSKDVNWYAQIVRL